MNVSLLAGLDVESLCQVAADIADSIVHKHANQRQDLMEAPVF